MEKCQDKPVEKCWDESKQVCKQVPAFMCEDVPRQECSQVVMQDCKDVHTQKCHTIQVPYTEYEDKEECEKASLSSSTSIQVQGCAGSCNFRSSIHQVLLQA